MEKPPDVVLVEPHGSEMSESKDMLVVNGEGTHRGQRRDVTIGFWREAVPQLVTMLAAIYNHATEGSAQYAGTPIPTWALPCEGARAMTAPESNDIILVELRLSEEMPAAFEMDRAVASQLMAALSALLAS